MDKDTLLAQLTQEIQRRKQSHADFLLMVYWSTTWDQICQEHASQYGPLPLKTFRILYWCNDLLSILKQHYKYPYPPCGVYHIMEVMALLRRPRDDKITTVVKGLGFVSGDDPEHLTELCDREPTQWDRDHMARMMEIFNAYLNRNELCNMDI